MLLSCFTAYIAHLPVSLMYTTICANALVLIGSNHPITLSCVYQFILNFTCIYPCLALSSVVALRVDSVSPDSACRRGSMHTSWHTSVRRLVVRSRTSLCRMIVTPLVGHERARSVVKAAPQTHSLGRSAGVQL